MNRCVVKDKRRSGTQDSSEGKIGGNFSTSSRCFSFSLLCLLPPLPPLPPLPLLPLLLHFLSLFLLKLHALLWLVKRNQVRCFSEVWSPSTSYCAVISVSSADTSVGSGTQLLTLLHIQ